MLNPPNSSLSKFAQNVRMVVWNTVVQEWIWMLCCRTQLYLINCFVCMWSGPLSCVRFGIGEDIFSQSPGWVGESKKCLKTVCSKIQTCIKQFHKSKHNSHDLSMLFFFSIAAIRPHLLPSWSQINCFPMIYYYFHQAGCQGDHWLYFCNAMWSTFDGILT